VRCRSLLGAMIILLIAAALPGCTQREQTTAPAQLSFDTPDGAVAALIAAAEKHDTTALQGLLGPGTENLISSGDEIADRKAREAFVARYHAYHQLVGGSPNVVVLLVGEDRWPVPIPLIRSDNRWSFDGDAGAEELVLRRIGANELRTIDVMQGFVVAQMEYFASGHDGAAPGVYARKLRSEPGKHDGLYWEVAPGEPQSPAGPLLAAAATEGYANSRGPGTPYHGYLFRPLTSQGPAANDGARDYLVDGRLTGGFALLAYPATYGASGVMTFIVNQDEVIWQRDLGTDTAQAAAAVQQFDPDTRWTPIPFEQGDLP
jgi:Protein of unknown function (DUF2950)